MTEFEKYFKEEFMPYTDEIREYLNGKKDTMTDHEQLKFFYKIQSEAPYYGGNLDILTKEEDNYLNLLDDIDDLAEEVEPFESCERENKKLLELMKKYNLM